ncbi:MAG: AraC family transcriptional regulator [Moraxellaceae bacterium]|nr:AraC family transcriptional regulator [Moraxellaceae bacterium]
MSSPYISSHYLREALHHAQAPAKFIENEFARAGIDPAILENPDACLTDMQFVSIMLALMQHTGDEFLIAGGRRRSAYGNFALLCQALIHLPTLKKAILRGIVFYNRQLVDIRFRLRQSGERAEISMHWDHPAQDPLHVTTEAMLTVAHRLSSWLVDQRIPLIEAHFAYPAPAHVEHYHRLFHCPLRFNQQRNSLIFSARYLNYPLMQNPASLRTFLRTPANLFVPPTTSQQLTGQVRALLGKDFTREFPEFEDVAAMLALAPQTLRRRLKDEGSSFQGIKDQVRRDAAIYYLSRPILSITEIAELMGFSEPSTFHRAFKKWTGITPGEYRQGLHR